MLRFLQRRPFVVIAVVAVGVLWPRPSSHVDAAPAIELWMAPGFEAVTARSGLAHAVSEFAAGRAEEALPVFKAAANDPVLGSYAQLFAARASMALSRPAEVSRIVDGIMASSPSQAVAESALSLAADAAALAADDKAAFQALTQLTSRPNSAPAANQFRLLQAAIEVSNRPAAVTAFEKLYFDYAATPEAADAIEEMQRIKVLKPVPTRATAARHLARAQALYAAGRYAEAKTAFVGLLPLIAGEDKELAQLRIAQSDVSLKKFLAASTALQPIAAGPTARAAEAQFAYLTALKGLGRIGEYTSGVRDFARRDSSAWAERAFNELGTYYIVNDEDAKAAEVFAEQYARFPQGAFADRAAWRSGWWAYRQGDYATCIRAFESAALAMRRADYRPAWLYWSARAHLALGHRDMALDGFRRVIADYRNSYYGRAAMQEAERVQAALRPAGAGAVSPARLTWPSSISPTPRPANGLVIEHLLAAGMYDDAIAELRRLQANGQGSPLVDATLAYALNRQGKLRLAISAMRRAYPQFMAEGGEALPQEILAVIFPVQHWALLQSHAAARGIDPFLLAALVAQESTFQADIKSSANAWGLMQVVPATGRRYAATLGIRPFSTFRLTEPDVNVQIGTSYFADLIRQFGGVVPALAAYNAGENRVVRWLAERPGLEQDEFIDDIPFPETQNYIKRIIGTAEDYRILYGRR